MAKRKPAKRVPAKRLKICPPAKAKGIKTSAEVEPFRRKRGEGPKKIIKKRVPVKRRRRKFSEVTATPEETVGIVVIGNGLDHNPPVEFVHRSWNTFDRRAINQKKDKLRKAIALKKRLAELSKRLDKASTAKRKRRLKKLRQRLRELVN